MQPNTLSVIPVCLTSVINHQTPAIELHNERNGAVVPSRSMQQLSMFSAYQRQGPFHVRRGSTDKAFRTMTSVLTPQNAGSDCVVLFQNRAICRGEHKCFCNQWNVSKTFSSRSSSCGGKPTHNCSTSVKKDLTPSFRSADLKISLPCEDERAIHVSGSFLR